MTIETHTYTHARYITCPYCGREDRDSWDVNFGPHMEGDAEVECGNEECEKTFTVNRYIDVTYSSELPKETK